MRPVSGSLAGLAAPIISKQRGWRREWHGFALVLLAGALLLSLGIRNIELAIGIFCGLSGLALLLRPRVKKLGGWLDTCLLLVVILPWLALLPASWLPFLEWRQAAQEAVALPLGYALAIAPLKLVEVGLLLIAAVGALYFMRSRPLDAKTRPILCMVIAWIGGLWSAGFLFIRLMNQATSDTAGMQLLGSTPLTAMILAACGLVAYGISLDGIRHKKTTRLSALIPLLMISITLVMLQSAIAFITLAACILVWTSSRLVASADSRVARVFIFALIVFVIHGFFALQGFREAFHTDSQLLPDPSLARFALAESPFFGLGAGQSEKWQSLDAELASNFDAKGFALWTELGLLGFGLVIALAIGFVGKLRKRGLHIESGYRWLTFLAAAICALAAILLDGYKNPILLFLLAATIVLSLGHGGRFQGHFFAERPVRVAGWLLLLSGCFYLFAYATALPVTHEQRLANIRTHVVGLMDKTDAPSRDRYASQLNSWVRLDPLDAQPYQLRAGHTLATTRDANTARTDFQRTRFLTDNNILKLREEAETWSRYLPEQAVEAWMNYLEKARKDGPHSFAEAFAALLDNIANNPPLANLARAYGREHSSLRHQYIAKLQGASFFEEIEEAFTDSSLDQAPDSALRQLATEAAKRNAFNLAERIAEKMDPTTEIGRDTRLAVQFQRGNITSAVRAALDNFEPADSAPVIDVSDTAGQEEQLLRLTRSNSPHRLEISNRLMALYIKTDQIARGRQLMRQLMRENVAPEFGLHWLAEILYRQGDHVESWEILRYQFPYLDILHE
jgi:hypothetical protein